MRDLIKKILKEGDFDWIQDIEPNRTRPQKGFIYRYYDYAVVFDDEDIDTDDIIITAVVGDTVYFDTVNRYWANHPHDPGSDSLNIKSFMHSVGRGDIQYLGVSDINESEEDNELQWIMDIKTNSDIAQEIYDGLEWYKEQSIDYVKNQWSDINFAVRPGFTEKPIISPSSFYRGFTKWTEEKWGIEKERTLDVYWKLIDLIHNKIKKPITESEEIDDFEWVRNIPTEIKCESINEGGRYVLSGEYEDLEMDAHQAIAIDTTSRSEDGDSYILFKFIDNFDTLPRDTDENYILHNGAGRWRDRQHTDICEDEDGYGYCWWIDCESINNGAVEVRPSFVTESTDLNSGTWSTRPKETRRLKKSFGNTFWNINESDDFGWIEDIFKPFIITTQPFDEYEESRQYWVREGEPINVGDFVVYKTASGIWREYGRMNPEKIEDANENPDYYKVTKFIPPNQSYPIKESKDFEWIKDEELPIVPYIGKKFKLIYGGGEDSGRRYQILDYYFDEYNKNFYVRTIVLNPNTLEPETKKFGLTQGQVYSSPMDRAMELINNGNWVFLDTINESQDDLDWIKDVIGEYIPRMGDKVMLKDGFYGDEGGWIQPEHVPRDGKYEIDDPYYGGGGYEYAYEEWLFNDKPLTVYSITGLIDDRDVVLTDMGLVAQHDNKFISNESGREAWIIWTEAGGLWSDVVEPVNTNY